MRISGIIWLREIVDKLLWKHNVTTDEVEEVLDSGPRYRRLEKGNVDGEDLYSGLGRTGSGRYLIVYFIYKSTREAMIVSARDMTLKEKRTHGRK